MADNTALLSWNNNENTSEMLIETPTLGQKTVDVSKLGSEGLYSIDPGFKSTASCKSAITYIDGLQGVLLYRGYPIDQLAEKCDYMEVCYLLMHGELPSAEERVEFVAKIKQSQSINEKIANLFNAFSQSGHPMGMLISALGALATYHPAIPANHEERIACAMDLVGKVSTLSAMSYRHTQGKPFVSPSSERSYAENFLHMMLNDGSDSPAINPVFIRAMDCIFSLHADHEQNASTSTVRMAGSTGTNPYAAIAAGVAALWGPAHGGANEAALKMLHTIGTEDQIEHYLEKAKDRDDPFRLMGFGHRVYKNYDPRAKLMRKVCHDVLEATGKENDPLFKLAMKLEKIALEDDYFVSRKLYPNIDFYSGITLSALGIPANMFSVIFALSRSIGWISHWVEMMDDPNQVLARPRQLYVGENLRDVK